MRHLPKHIAIALISWSLNMVTGPLAQAHLMPAQHGTLNILDHGVFMVLSLPISAFDGIDDNEDGAVSLPEFNNHRGTIVDTVRHNITLSDEQGNGSLQGVLLSPASPHDATGKAISQITVMGRFVARNTGNAMSLHIGLYGKLATQQVLKITATRTRDNYKTAFELTPSTPASVIFPDTAQALQMPVAWHL